MSEYTSEKATKESNWSWFVWPKTNKTKQLQSQNESEGSTRKQSTTKTLENEFEVVQQAINSTSHTASYDQLLENNFQINDQYVNLNEYGTTVPIQTIDDDIKNDTGKETDDENENEEEKDENIETETVEDNNGDGDDDDETVPEQNDAVMISQTLTLRSRNEELQKERDELHSETLQLRMQTECLRQTNDHIIAAQQQEIEKLQKKNKEKQNTLNEKDEELRKAQKQIAMLERERDNLKKKLHDICYNRLNIIDKNEVEMAKSEVLVSNNHVIYGCIQCGQHLFDSRAMIQRQIEIDDNTFGLIVDGLFNNNDATMGPTVCKTFLNGMYKVKEIFCDSCLSTFGWKICESFDEWNSLYSNKFCIDSSTIKQVSIMSD